MSKEKQTLNKQESRSLFKLNSKVEILDEILERRGQITIRYVERIRYELLKEIKNLIDENCA